MTRLPVAGVALLLVLVSAATSLEAQGSRWSPRVAAGLDALGPETPLTGFRPSVDVAAGLDWRAPKGRLLLGVTAHGTERRSEGLAGPIRTRVLTVLVEARFFLTMGAVRPYVMTGYGGSLLADRRALAAADGGGVQTRTETGWARSAAIGMEWRWGRAQLFGEVGYLRLDNPNVTRPHLLPITIGVRF